MKRFLLSFLTLLMLLPISARAEDITSSKWTKVTSDSIETGARYIMIAPKKFFCSYTVSSSVLTTTGSLSSDESKITSIPSDAAIFTFEETTTSRSYKVKISDYSGTSKGYYTTSKVKSMSLGDSGTDATISIAYGGGATITFGSYGKILANLSSPRFLNYTSNTSSTMVLPYLYKEEKATTAAVTLTKKSTLPTVEVGAADVAFADFVDISVEGDDEDGSIATKLASSLSFSVDDASADYVSIQDGKVHAEKETPDGTNAKITVSLAANSGLNTAAAEDITLEFPVLPMEAVEEHLAFAVAPPTYLLMGSEFEAKLTADDESALSLAEIIVGDGYADYLEVEKVSDDTWKFIPKGIKDEIPYTLQFPEGGKYNSDATTASLSVIPGKVVSEDADEDGNISISAGKSVTFTSEGAEKLSIKVDEAAAEEKENGFAYTFSTEGTYTVVVTPIYGETAYSGDDYGVSSTFTVSVTTAPLYDAVDDTLNVSNFGIKASYTIYTYTSEGSGVGYAAKAYSSSGMQLNSKNNTGIVSVSNPNERIIDKIVVTKNGGTGSFDVYAGNTPNTVDESSSKVSAASDATKISCDEDTTYTYTLGADKEYQYFAVISTGVVQLDSVVVTYREKWPGAPATEAVLTLTGDATRELEVGETLSGWLAASVNGEASADALAAVTYSVEPEGVVSVADDGTITATGAGTAVITPSLNSSKFVASGDVPTLTVTVTKAAVIPEAVVSDPAADEEGNISIYVGASVTFSSEGAEKLQVSVQQGDADAVTTVVDAPYSYTFEAVGTYTVTVKPADADGVAYEQEGLAKTFTVEVAKAPLVDKIIAQTFASAAAAYSCLGEKQISETVGVYYAAKATIQNTSGVLYIGLNTSTTNRTNIGVGSTLNSKGKVIDKVVIVTKDATTTQKDLVVQMGNTPNTYTDDGFVIASDATTIEKSEESSETDKRYIYSPGKNYQYFSITATGAVSIVSIEVYYKYDEDVTKSEVTLKMDENINTSLDINDSIENWLTAYVANEASEDALKSVVYSITEGEGSISLDAAGKIVALAAGAAKVTATIPSSDANYQLAEDIELSVTVSENLAEVISKSNFSGLSNTYSLSSFTSEVTGVEYATKAASASTVTTLTINTNSTGNPVNSGIASVYNPGRVIDRIIVTAAEDNTNAFKIMTGNTPNTTVASETASESAVNPALDAEEADVTNVDNVYTFIPKSESRYFAITSTGSVKLENIRVVYKPYTVKENTPVLSLTEKYESGEVSIARGSTVSLDDLLESSIGDALFEIVIAPVTAGASDYASYDKENYQFKALNLTATPQQFVAYVPDSDSYNASNAISFTVTVTKLQCMIDVNSEMQEYLPVGESVKVLIDAYPDENEAEILSEIVVTSGDEEKLKAEKIDGEWWLTAVEYSSNYIEYTVSLPDDSPYEAEAADGIIEIIPGIPTASVEANANQERFVKVGDSVTFSSEGAVKLNVEIDNAKDGSTETFDADGSEYVHSFDNAGIYMVTITPYTYNSDNEPVKCEQNVVRASFYFNVLAEASLPQGDDVLTLSSFGVSGNQ